MRLYNQESCTPVGTPTLSRKGTQRSPPKEWIPKRSTSEQHSFASPLRSVSLQELRDDQTTPFLETPSPVYKRSIPRLQGNEQVFRNSPQTLTEWPFHSTESPIRRRTTWCPTKTNSSATGPVPGVNPKLALTPVIKLKPRPTKKDQIPPVVGIKLSSNLASLNLQTETGESDEPFSIPKLSTTDESSINSSTWLEFSLDESMNQAEDNQESTKARFSPIRKVKSQSNLVMVVKPTALRRKKPISSKIISSSPRPSAAPAFCSYGSSAFVVTQRSSSFRRSLTTPGGGVDAGSGHGTLPTRPTTSRRVSPRWSNSKSTTMSTRSTMSTRDNVHLAEHLSKYSRMLKSGYAFDHVRRMMERDKNVDPSVVELLRLAYAMGSS